MEQIKLRTVWALLLCAFSYVVVFAEEGSTGETGAGGGGASPSSVSEQTVDTSQQASASQKSASVASPNDRIGGITANLPGVLFFGVPAGVIILLILLFNLLFLLKAKKENLPELIKNGFEELKSKQDSLQQTVDKNKTEISSKLERAAPIETRHSAPVVQDNSAQYKTTIAQLQQQVAELKATISKLQEEASNAKDSLDPVAAFNRWASNPQTALPKAFYYIEGEMKIREERVLNESKSSDSKWITNRSGPQKYLFPNPNSFTQMTVINLLYKITGNLKAKGENKIKITKACDMSTNGFVEFAGELEIL